MREAVVAHPELRELFAGLLSVDKVRTFKPSPAVYQVAAESSGLEKSTPPISKYRISSPG